MWPELSLSTDHVFVSAVPAPTTGVNQPFLSLSSAAASAAQAVLSSLRRELDLTRSSNVRLTTLNIGRFDIETLASSNALRPDTLPTRLSTVYGSALSRTAWLSPVAGGHGGTTPARKLGRKVFNVIVRSRGGRESSIGGGAVTYRVLGWLPHAVVDLIIGFHDRVAQMAIAHQARFGSTALNQTRAPRPLPTPPAQHPDALRPGYAPAPAAAAPGTATSTVNGTGAQETDSSEEDNASSIEDFGLDQSGLGSFVNVEGQNQ